MGGSRIQANKPHKSRFSSKSSRSNHKRSQRDTRISKSSHNVIKRARDARLQHNKMVREQKRTTFLKEKRATSGISSPPRIIVLFGLSASVATDSLAKDLMALLSGDPIAHAISTVASSEYNLRATILKAPHGNLQDCLEMAKVCDLVGFVTSAKLSGVDGGSRHVDPFGRQCLSAFRSLGMPNPTVFINDLPSEPKKRNDSKKKCVSALTNEFPIGCKFHAADSREDLEKFLRHFKEQRISVPHWRALRPYLMSEQVELEVDECSSETCSVVVSGYLRARNLSVNQLVHISGIGDFQLQRIDLLKDPFPLNPRKDPNCMDLDATSELEVLKSLEPDVSKQEQLVVENVPDPLAGEQTWPTEVDMEEAGKRIDEKKSRKKHLPQGCSEYQAVWILNDSNTEDSGSESNMSDGMPSDDMRSMTRIDNSNQQDDGESLELGDSDAETDKDSMMTEDESMTKSHAQDEINRLKAAHDEDEEFPDEIDTPMYIPAKKRFAKYRGLKSFRTSSWDPKESLPPEYARIFAFDNFPRTQKTILASALSNEVENTTDFIFPGQYTRLHIKGIPISVASRLHSRARTVPLIVSGLLKHESKMSVLHFSVRKHDMYDRPIKSREELVFHVGFRQFLTRPVFSVDSINSNKNKMERFLHAARFSVASVYAPISFPPLPLVVLKCSSGGDPPLLSAVGSLRSVDPDRIILKKIILSGYPHRVSKLKASVRYMFHNPEDVKWFKPVEVWTKHGRRGRIKEPVGTHGSMKCTFNAMVQQHDTVCMSLYKRVYPKWLDQHYPVFDS